LREQTFQDFEWIVVDDLFDKREFALVADFPISHIPPYGGVVPYDAPSRAINTGIVHAQGQLLHIMHDYVRLTPDVLARHWEIFEEYGPKCIISGPRIPVEGEPEGKAARLRANPDKMVTPRVGEVDSRILAFSCGVNDSVPAELVRKIGGVNEAWDGSHGGADYDLAARLLLSGCRYLIDMEAPVYEYPHSPNIDKRFHWEKQRVNKYFGMVGLPITDVIGEYQNRQRRLTIRTNQWMKTARREVCAA